MDRGTVGVIQLLVEGETANSETTQMTSTVMKTVYSALFFKAMFLSPAILRGAFSRYHDRNRRR